VVVELVLVAHLVMVVLVVPMVLETLVVEAVVLLKKTMTIMDLMVVQE
jgi:hypothetical protein